MTRRPRRRCRSPAPSVEGPITTGNGGSSCRAPRSTSPQPATSEAEYFISRAARYTSARPLAADGSGRARRARRRTAPGSWCTGPSTRRGSTARSWSSGSTSPAALDARPSWIFLHREQIREGDAWVGVSAQAVGVIGGESIMGLQGRRWEADPVRYGTARATRAIASPTTSTRRPASSRAAWPATVLGDLAIERVLAIGESQSAFRLTTYVNASTRSTQVYDGFLVHAARRHRAALDATALPAFTATRTCPSATDLACRCSVRDRNRPRHARLLPARQPDNDRFRSGRSRALAHADVYTFVVGPIDPATARRSPARRARGARPLADPGFELDASGERRPPALRAPRCAAPPRPVGTRRHAAPDGAAPRVDATASHVRARRARERARRDPHPARRRAGRGALRRRQQRRAHLRSVWAHDRRSTLASSSPRSTRRTPRTRRRFVDGDRPCRRGRVPAGRRRRRDQCDRRAQLPSADADPHEGLSDPGRSPCRGRRRGSCGCRSRRRRCRTPRRSRRLRGRGPSASEPSSPPSIARFAMPIATTAPVAERRRPLECGVERRRRPVRPGRRARARAPRRRLARGGRSRSAPWLGPAR